MRFRDMSALVVLGVLLFPAAAGAQNPGQKFFLNALIKDAKTTPAVRDALKSKAAIVDPATEYADLTSDKKSDAIVRVHSTGAAGVIAVYVFSTDGQPKGALRVVFRSQRLYRALTSVVSGDQMRIDTPKYEAGDELCCPAELTRRTYEWSKKAKSFRRVSMTTVKA